VTSRCVEILFLAIFLAACSNSRAPEQSILGTNDVAKIYEGSFVANDSLIAHSTVQISIDNFKYGCTGNVLSPTIILTAAHCVVDDDKDGPSTVLFSPSGIQIEDTQKSSKYINAVKVIVHPKYVAHGTVSTRNFFARGYDLALIQLDSPLSDYYKPFKITSDLKAIAKENIMIAGFGGSRADSLKDPSPGLRSGPVKIPLSQKSLSRQTEFKNDDGSSSAGDVLYFVTGSPFAPFFAFARENSTAGICGGDSGGPLYFEKNGRVYLLGVNAATFDPAGARKGSCAANGINISVSLAGPALGLVLDGLKELNADIDLKDLSRPPLKKDPNAFDFYLSKNTKSSFNSFLDLRELTLTQTKEGLFDIESCADPRIRQSEISLSRAASTDKLDGQKIVTLNKYVGENPTALFEARLLLEGNQARLVALTPEGYLSAQIPVGPCP